MTITSKQGDKKWKIIQMLRGLRHKKVMIVGVTSEEEFGRHATRPYEKFLSKVIGLYEKTERDPIAGRVQQVIERCTK